jgi:hypothetical protein
MAPPVRAAPDEIFTMRPPPAACSRGTACTQAEERAVEVHGQGAPPGLRRRCRSAIESPAYSRIVDEGVEAPEPIVDRGDG